MTHPACNPGSNLAKQRNKQKYRNPDDRNNAKQDLKSLISYQPRRGARAIAPHMNLKNNASHSFNVFVQGVSRLAEQM